MTPPVAGKAGIVRRGGRLSDVKSCETREVNARAEVEDALRRRSVLTRKARIICEVCHKRIAKGKMASSEQAEDPMMPPTVDVNISRSKIDEEGSSITLLANEDNESCNAAADEEVTKEAMSEQKGQNNATEERKDDVEHQSKHDLRSQITDKNEQKEDVRGVKQETGSMSPEHLQDDTKDPASNEDDSVKSGAALRRKRKSQSSSISPMDSPMDESGVRTKRKKLKSTNDRFCWRCHKEPVDVYCTACPRSWHRKCIGGTPPSPQKWICGECATILTAENAETRSTAMAQLSVDQLCMLLKYVVERLREYPGSEPFCKAVDLDEVPNYLDYVIKPMDLSLLESNVRSKLYGSTDAFMADAKWIQHNCIVFNTCGGVYADTSKLTNASKQIIKVARSEVSEIEACPDCYAHGRNLPRPQPTWFIEPCRRPHPLVWAKLKGFPFWPAKAMPRLNSQGFVDVRFFGEHDRAWVSPKDLYLYSEEPPAPSPRKRKSDMDECVREITRHCRKLELMFGQFKFAPSKVQYNPNDPMQITLMLPNYNPMDPNNRLVNVESFDSKRRPPPRKRSLNKSLNDGLVNEIKEEPNSSKNSVDGDNQEEEASPLEKVQKLDPNVAKNNPQNNLNGNHSKLSEKVDQEVGPSVAQNKSAKDGAKRVKTPLVKGNNGPNRTVSGNPQKVKNDAKSEQSAKPPRESAEVKRMRKRSSVKNAVSPKHEALQNMLKSPAKNAAKSSLCKTYKPKKQMVDKLNAEQALKSVSASKENDRLTSGPAIKRSGSGKADPAKKKTEIDVTPPAGPLKTFPRIEPRPVVQSVNLQGPVSFTSVDPKPVLLLMMNNSGTPAEVAKQQTVTIMTDYPGNKDALVTLQREAKETSPQKKESKAKKTFPSSKSRTGSRTTVSTTESTTQLPKSNTSSNTASNTASNTSSSTSSNTYQLIPPEAGPITARLHHSAQELVRRMGQLMEEAYKEAAEAGDGNGENGTADNYQATIFFLRMQIEHMKWQHQQQMAELKHNADRTMREMRASMEAEKLRSVQEARREVEEDKMRCIEETKRKQWCAKCGQEALFYCCWNTAYCDYPCQQLHWPMHMRTCSQKPAFTTIVTSSSNSQAQVMPRLVFNAASGLWKA
ncbi:PREDICTED: protein kinase C-binding protein 1 isoform X2 [Dinoponera quadriceps]|uniref:Protein kinase C-binding protein 1 isoform X2 n=1 Tax=Dinoponera quadriceps TaxID=609295 RepID=A0A6P3X3C8_DINQU|nr:PREDICTED: protein kinase C-binding protein 1 isoform X2 [Dinoponera quadriceps]